MKYILFCTIFILLAGCQTTDGILISENLLSLKETRIAITSVLGPIRSISENGRELVSQYHDKKTKFLDVTAKTKERYYTQVIILGPRRPYEINVQVHHEIRDPGNQLFQDVGLDLTQSTQQAKLIKEALNQSRDKGQAIDEGAPF